MNASTVKWLPRLGPRCISGGQSGDFTSIHALQAHDILAEALFERTLMSVQAVHNPCRALRSTRSAAASAMRPDMHI